MMIQTYGSASRLTGRELVFGAGEQIYQLGRFPMFGWNYSVEIRELETGKWFVEMDTPHVRAYGTSKDDAYSRFIAVYEMYKEYGEDWMATILAEYSEEYVDANIEMNEDPWSPDSPA